MKGEDLKGGTTSGSLSGRLRVLGTRSTLYPSPSTLHASLFTLLTLFALFPSGPLPLQAQSAAERLRLDRLGDSLAAIGDTTSLRTLQRGLERAARGPTDVVLQTLRLGLVSHRLGQLGADSDFSDALTALRRATERAPDWPYAWQALALAEVERSAWERSNPLALGNRVGVGTLERALRHHRRALEADPGFAPAATALADLTLELHDTAFTTSARDALRRSGAIGHVPEVLLAWGRVERAAGDCDSAATVFERFLSAGGARGLGLLELARTRLAQDLAADSTYFEGAALDDSLAVAGYREDLAVLAADSELARFDGLRGARRAEFLREFWTARDHLELRSDGERLREHYRRLLYARRHFALTLSRRFYGRYDAYRSGSTEIDDRGVIYVRHGEPAERLRPFVFGLMPNESWRYARAEGDLLFHFSSGWDENGGGDLYDYRLVESVLDLHGAGDAPPDQLLLSRQSLSPVYGRMLNWGRFGRARSAARERGMGQASIIVGTTTDSYELQFTRPLAALASVVAVGRVGNAGLAHLVFAVARGGTAPQLEGGSAVYPIRVRLAVLDPADHALARMDTTLIFRLSRPLEAGGYLIGRVELPVPSGRWTWRAALQQGDSAGVVLPRDTLRVAGGGPGLGLSDLALGIRGASALWEAAPGDTVHLTPFDLFRRGAAVELYYEARGAVPGASYRHDVAVYRLKGDPPAAERRPVVSLSFQEPSADSVVRAHRTVQLGRFKPGRYVVEVRVTGTDGAGDVRRREIQVVGD